MRALPLLVAGIVGVVVSACSLGGTASSSTGRSHIVPGTPLRHFRGDGIEFYYPAAWSYRHPGIESHFAAPVIDLSTQPMVDPCTHNGNATTCGLPVSHMRAGGAVVVWSTWGGFGVLAHGPHRAVRIRVIRAGCRDIGGDEIITAQIATRHHEVFLATACLRGPGIAANERAFRAMVRSAVATA